MEEQESLYQKLVQEQEQALAKIAAMSLEQQAALVEAAELKQAAADLQQALEKAKMEKEQAMLAAQAALLAARSDAEVRLTSHNTIFLMEPSTHTGCH